MVSILAAQYVQTSNTTYGDEGAHGKTVATLIFVVSNTLLLVLHAVLVAVPLWKKVSAGYAAIKERLAPGANQSIISFLSL